MKQKKKKTKLSGIQESCITQRKDSKQSLNGKLIKTNRPSTVSSHIHVSGNLLRTLTSSTGSGGGSAGCMSTAFDANANLLTVIRPPFIRKRVLIRTNYARREKN